MPGIPADQVLTILRIRQWAQDRQALKTAKTTDYGWTQRKRRSIDARIVRVISFERAFAKLETEQHQQVLAATYRDNLNQDEIAALIGLQPAQDLLPSAHRLLPPRRHPQPPRPAVKSS